MTFSKNVRRARRQKVSCGGTLSRRGDKAAAEREWKTISKKDRKNLGLTKKEFVKEYLVEIKEVRRSSRRNESTPRLPFRPDTVGTPKTSTLKKGMNDDDIKKRKKRKKM